MFRKFLFKRVEQWINGLEPEYQTKGYIKSSLGLLKILGMPTDFSNIISTKKLLEADSIDHKGRVIDKLTASRIMNRVRAAELNKLAEYLV